MKASRRDFDAIAQIFKSGLYLAKRKYEPHALLTCMAEDVANLLARSNATFDKEQFIAACGLDKEKLHG